MNVAELIVRCLVNEDVECVYGVPGEETEDLLFALEGSPIEFVPVRHEQGGAFMANVHGRVTGRAGVCLATLGPGATNLVTGVADANLDKAPLVAITAQGDLGRLHHESHQALDIVDMMRPITKWNTSITTPRIVPEVVRKAFKLAEAEKPGATHLELPEDVAAAAVPDHAAPLRSDPVRRPGPDSEAIARATRLLTDARRPLVIAGNGGIRTRASRDLTRLAHEWDLPVVATFMGKGALRDDDPRSLMTMGLGFRDHVIDAFETADAVLCVGYDIAEVPPERWNVGEGRPIVHVDFEPAEVYAAYTPNVEIVGDIALSLRALAEACVRAAPDWDAGWYEPLRTRIRDDVLAWRRDDDEQPTVPAALIALRDALDDGGLLISDVGSHKMWIARNFPVHCPNGCIISNGLASMGIALPGAIAAACTQPQRQVVAAMGDGGFLMNAAELETAARLGVSFVCIVFNDDDYGLISWKQRRHRGRSVSTRIANPDLKLFAESFGVEGVRTETMGALRRALPKALAHDGVTLIEVPIDTSVNDELVQGLQRRYGER